MQTLVDTHCHLDLAQFDTDRSQVIDRALARGITTIVVPAIDLPSCRRVTELADQYENVYAAVGIHPNDIPPNHSTDRAIKQIRIFAESPKVVAIGEIGLDYYWDKTPPSRQRKWLCAQLDLAVELDLPVILHNRESTADLLDLLHDWVGNPTIPNSTWAPGVLHSFSGTLADAQEALDLGFYLGFTGPLTYKSANVMREVAAGIPGDRMVVETDAPFLSPHPQRGTRNEPANVEWVASKLAEIRGTNLENISMSTTQNAQSLFRNRLA